MEGKMQSKVYLLVVVHIDKGVIEVGFKLEHLVLKTVYPIFPHVQYNRPGMSADGASCLEVAD